MQKKKINNYHQRIKFLKNKINKNPLHFTAIVLGILVLGLLANNLVQGAASNVISEQEAGVAMINFAKSQGVEASLVEVNDKGSFYETVISVQGQQLPLYVTKDGKFFTQAIIPLTDSPVINNQQTPQSSNNVIKSNKPTVELFVMSYCPYGTQAEKGILPVVALLKDKIDFKLRTVHYILHGEKEDLENKRQLCIREEQGQDLLNKYLVCILDSNDPYSPKDVSVCEKEAGINSNNLQTCLEAKADEYFDLDSKLSQSYGVKGSPTLIINGIESKAGRSPASYLAGICNAFNDVPKECSEVLSSSTPSAGFGYKEGTDSIAKC